MKHSLKITSHSPQFETIALAKSVQTQNSKHSSNMWAKQAKIRNIRFFMFDKTQNYRHSSKIVRRTNNSIHSQKSSFRKKTWKLFNFMIFQKYVNLSFSMFTFWVFWRFDTFDFSIKIVKLTFIKLATFVKCKQKLFYKTFKILVKLNVLW